MDYRLEQLRYALKEDPSSRQFYQLGELLRREGLLDEAAGILRQGLTHHPRYVSAHIALGRTLIEKREHAEAEQVLATALNLDPENAVAARLIGQSAMARGDHLRAIQALKLARALGDSAVTLEEEIAEVESELARQGLLHGAAEMREPDLAIGATPEDPQPESPEPFSMEGEDAHEAPNAAGGPFADSLANASPEGEEAGGPTASVGEATAAFEGVASTVVETTATEAEAPESMAVPEPPVPEPELSVVPEDDPFAETAVEPPHPADLDAEVVFAAEDLPPRAEPDHRAVATEAEMAVPSDVVTPIEADELAEMPAGGVRVLLDEDDTSEEDEEAATATTGEGSPEIDPRRSDDPFGVDPRGETGVWDDAADVFGSSGTLAPEEPSSSENAELVAAAAPAVATDVPTEAVGWSEPAAAADEAVISVEPPGEVDPNAVTEAQRLPATSAEEWSGPTADEIPAEPSLDDEGEAAPEPSMVEAEAPEVQEPVGQMAPDGAVVEPLSAPPAEVWGEAPVEEASPEGDRAENLEIEPESLAEGQDAATTDLWLQHEPVPEIEESISSDELATPTLVRLALNQGDVDLATSTLATLAVHQPDHPELDRLQVELEAARREMSPVEQTVESQELMSEPVAEQPEAVEPPPEQDSWISEDTPPASLPVQKIAALHSWLQAVRLASGTVES